MIVLVDNTREDDACIKGVLELVTDHTGNSRFLEYTLFEHKTLLVVIQYQHSIIEYMCTKHYEAIL